MDSECIFVEYQLITVKSRRLLSVRAARDPKSQFDEAWAK